MISKTTIQNIIDAVRIEEVIGDYVNLRKRGANMIGLCPFHNEKTPSFSVSPSKGIYKCFGCGKAGNAVNFIMDHEHYSYPEALKYLAKRYNIEIEEDEYNPEEQQAASERESMFLVNSYAAEFFTKKLLNSEQGKAIGLTYLRDKRGFSEDIIKKFELGYTINEWDSFYKAATDAGYNKEFLVKTGLVVEKEDKKYDLFRDRIMFPIHNIAGRIVGFGGRMLGSDKTKPKYVNSPESLIYNKSEILYGIYFAKSAISSSDNCYLVEGYTDVISLVQAGIKNVVASSGTSLTVGQIKLIRRYTTNITILYDGDTAGIKASFRGIDMIVSEGMNVKIVLFPEGEDPDSFAQSRRPAEVQEYITKNASDFITFKTNLLLKEVANDPVKKAALVKEIIHTISLIPDPITRSFYLRECSSLMDIAEQTLMNELNKQLRNKNKQFDAKKFINANNDVVVPEPQPIADLFDSYEQEKEVIRLLLNYGNEELKFVITVKEEDDVKEHIEEISISVAEFIVSEIERDAISFSDNTFKEIYNEYVQKIKNNEHPNSAYFLSHPNFHISNTASSFLFSNYDLANWMGKPKIFVPAKDQDLKKVVETAILSFKSKRVEQQIYENKSKIIKAQAEDDFDLLMELLKSKKVLDDIKKIINADKLGRVIIR